MVSRSEELTPAVAAPTPLGRFLEERLTTLLPEEATAGDSEPGRPSVDFHDGATPEGPTPTPEPSQVTGATETTEATPFLVARLHPESPQGFSEEALPRLRRWLDYWHRLLPVGAHLLLAVPEDHGGPAQDGDARVPSHRPSAVRQTILLLSEHGFAVRKEARAGAKAFKTWARDRGLETSTAAVQPWHLICSRRDPFHIRPYTDGDEAAILELFPTCFHVSRSEAHWRWKYRQNPYGETAISLALSDREELAAHYAGYAMPFFYDLGQGRRRFPALQMGDTMTNPRFRRAGGGRNGLLGRTVKHFFALHRGGPYGFFYGFNTGPIQRFCRWFIGGSRVEPVGFWRYAETAPADSWSTTGYRVEPLQEANAEVDRLFRQAAPHYGFLVQRDARYVRWRYLSCPDTDYSVLAIRRWHRLVGWGVFRLHDGRLIWGDSLLHPRHQRAAGALLATAKASLGNGDEPIEAWFSSRPQWWSRRLGDLGFVRYPQPQGLGFMALPDGDPEATEHLADLYYTMGDGDLF